MRRLSAYAIVIVLSLGAATITTVGSGPFGLAIGVAVGFGVPFVDGVLDNFRYLKLEYYSVRYRGQHIRFSISYLYRIKIDGHYLLVKGTRFPQFQPVGGVYKALPNSSVLAQFGALNDDLLPVDPVSEHDLRVRIPVRNLRRFVTWFEGRHDRESGPWREFFEELIQTGVLPRDEFGYVNARYVATVQPPLRYSDYAKSHEILIAEVFEVVPSSSQTETLRRLLNDGHPEILWATEAQIRRLGAVPGENQAVKIAETAVWTVDA
ncbi:MAG: hypothetical protein JWM34_1012 [Ilumatobacteraceae bacterium]|nr:hypothetical protein [Ilumatobacteraceae bacterium]